MKQLWFVIGSQHLYGDETIRQVADHAAEMAEYFNEKLPYEVILKPIATTSDIITSIPESRPLRAWRGTYLP